MRDDALAESDEFRVAHVVLGIVGAPRADDEAPCAVGFEHMIDGRQKREGQLVGGAAQFGGGVVIGADQRPVQFFAGVEVMGAVVADGFVNVLPELLAGQFQMPEPLAIPNEMRRRLAPQPADIGGVLDAETSGDGVAAFVGYGHSIIRRSVTSHRRCPIVIILKFCEMRRLNSMLGSCFSPEVRMEYHQFPMVSLSCETECFLDPA